ncbi:MAG: ribosome biogenesis GTPase Der [Planctomycetia bacterium]|nr:ribosome biogenesis GTPase Der [Planctomycetia bacterium]
MYIPKIVIVGRPNVGKSSLFNWIVGKRLSIVDPQAGVTRDWMSSEIEIEGRVFEIFDTGGMGILDPDNLTEDIENQIQTAIEMADMILYVVDAREGVVSLDEHVARRLRRLAIPILCVANKVDHPKFENHIHDFYRFGWDIISVSAKEKRGRDELQEYILEHLPEKMQRDMGEDADSKMLDMDSVMKIAIVGRRNTGKSTFVNTLVKFPRMIVSNVAGTTRDSVNVQFEMDGKKFIAVDTPGFRRRVSVKTNVDYYGTHRAQRSVRFADVTLMFFDCSSQISKVDKQLVAYIAQENKPCIFVVNKWDLMKDHMKTDAWADYLRDTFPTMWHVPIAFITGQTGKNVKTLLNHAQMLFKQARTRVHTSKLNRLVRAALMYSPPPLYRTTRPKIYFATQTGILPPTIVLFCNNPDMFSPTYRRYMLSVIRDQLDFGEVPIRLFFRKREANDKRDDVEAHLAEVREKKQNAASLKKQEEIQAWFEAQAYYEEKYHAQIQTLQEEEPETEVDMDEFPGEDMDFPVNENEAAHMEEEDSFLEENDNSETEEKDFDLSQETFLKPGGEVFLVDDDFGDTDE